MTSRHVPDLSFSLTRSSSPLSPDRNTKDKKFPLNSWTLQHYQEALIFCSLSPRSPSSHSRPGKEGADWWKGVCVCVWLGGVLTRVKWQVAWPMAYCEPNLEGTYLLGLAPSTSLSVFFRNISDSFVCPRPWLPSPSALVALWSQTSPPALPHGSDFPHSFPRSVKTPVLCGYVWEWLSDWANPLQSVNGWVSLIKTLLGMLPVSSQNLLWQNFRQCGHNVWTGFFSCLYILILKI